MSRLSRRAALLGAAAVPAAALPATAPKAAPPAPPSKLFEYAKVHRAIREKHEGELEPEPTPAELWKYVGGEEWHRTYIPTVRLAIRTMELGEDRAREIVAELNEAGPEMLAELVDGLEGAAGHFGSLIDVMCLAFERLDRAMTKLDIKV